MREKKYSTSSKDIGEYVEGLLNYDADQTLAFVLDQAKKKGTPPMQMTPADARHLEVLSRGIGARKIVEIGTLCGYSSVCLARTLPEGGKLYTCERSKHHAQVAQSTFAQLNLSEKVELLFGDALTNLKELKGKGPFDLVFIDADKDNYPNYFDWAVENLRPGGLLVADNVFVFGHIANNPEGRLGEFVDTMKVFNEKCAKDPRLLCTFLPTGEGLMVAVKL